MTKLGALLLALAVTLFSVPLLHAVHVLGGADVEITADNNNVDGGTPNPGVDTQNRQANEPTAAISPIDPDIVAAGANDYRMVSVFGDSWLGVYVSDDGGASWFNTMVPGFPSDTSAAGLASPLLNLDATGDPVVRFDDLGNLYVSGIGFNRNFDQPDRPVDNVIFVAKYAYTPGTPGGVSTPNSAANPPNFTYAGTTVVDRGAVGFAVPGQPFGFAGNFLDKEWMAADHHPASACAGNVYVTYTSFHGLAGSFPIVLRRSTDGAASFSRPIPLSSGGRAGTARNQGSGIAIAPDGTIYVAYRTFAQGSDVSAVSVVSSRDCGERWTKPVTATSLVSPQAPGVAFRTPTFAFVAADDTDSNVVYIAYQNFDVGGSGYNIYVQRSTDGGVTWDAPRLVNDDGGSRHQIFPTVAVSNGALHVAWYDFRNSATPDNEALDVYYACTNCDGNAYPAFSHNERVTDSSHNGNCLLFGGGTVAFHGDYIELDARWDGANHVVHVTWADNRDVNPCDLDPAAGPPSNNTGNRNQNIYGDTLIVSP